MKPPDPACHTRSHLGVRSPPPTMVLSRTEHTPLLDGGTRLIPRARARVARSRGDISFRLSVIVVAGNGLDPPGFARRARLMTRVAPVSSRLPFPCPSSRAPPRRSARPESDLSERPVDPLAAADEQTTSGSRITARTALRASPRRHRRSRALRRRWIRHQGARHDPRSPRRVPSARPVSTRE